MRLTYFTDFGLRALMLLAREPERGFSTAELADEFGISRHHLLKIIQKLAQAGIVSTRRGGGGGAMLARDPREIGLGAIIDLLEEGQSLVDCFAPGGTCCLSGNCRLQPRLRAAERAFLQELNRSTLADIALPPRNSGLLRNDEARVPE